jgi:hypothetical protein
MQLSIFAILFVVSAIMCSVHAGSKDKPHAHKGVLKPYDGRHISYNISAEQNRKLMAGDPVSLMILCTVVTDNSATGDT